MLYLTSRSPSYLSQVILANFWKLSVCNKLFCSATTNAVRRERVASGPGLEHFMQQQNSVNNQQSRPAKIDPPLADTEHYLHRQDMMGNSRKVKFATYGCQMNVNDTEVVRSVLLDHAYKETSSYDDADIVLLVTCSIRENAEAKIWDKLRQLKVIKRARQRQNRPYYVGILGCMAERLKQELLQKSDLVDIVAGPDAYRDLPRLLAVSNTGRSAVNVQLSLEETYADISPVRVDETATTAFVSIMRGCDNMCTYCIVPFTRGRERSRPIDSIVDEIRRLSDRGVKQVTLLGQNVNSYRDMTESKHFTSESILQQSNPAAQGFKTVYRVRSGGRPFADLLARVSQIDPEMRFRFTSPHPKDFPVEVLQLISERPNICNQLHLPAQSGNNSVLESMGRGYSRENYLKLVDTVRSIIPDVSLTSDFIAGFCGETELAHSDTLSLIGLVKYDFCYVFPYSMRAKTRAHYRLEDNVDQSVKKRRHGQLAEAFRNEAEYLHRALIGTEQLVLVESESRRCSQHMVGRCDGGTKVILQGKLQERPQLKPGDYVSGRIISGTSQTLIAEPISRTTLTRFYNSGPN